MLTVSGLKFYASGTRKVCLGVEANVFLPRKINRTGDSVPALFCVSVPCTNHVQRHAVYCANYPSLHVPLFNFHISSFHISSASFYSSTARPTGCGGTMFSTYPSVRACVRASGRKHSRPAFCRLPVHVVLCYYLYHHHHKFSTHECSMNNKK